MDEQDFAALNLQGRSIGSSTPEYGAATQVWAAVSHDVTELGGVYLSDCAVAEAAPYATDEARALALWHLSEDLCTAAVGA